MKRRAIAILNDNDCNATNVYSMLSMLMANVVSPEIYVFTETPNGSFNISNERSCCNNICFPIDCTTITQRRNWINSYFKTQQFDGTLYVIEDSVEFLKVPTQFFDELEHMMSVFDYPVWFNTICDRCNYVYNKYCPRINIALDKPEYLKFELSNVYFTSHANTAIVAYDFSKVSDDLLKFNENFTVPMYFIIEYMARRRNTKPTGSIFYMNQYLTVPSEHLTFKQHANDKNFSKELMQQENSIFMNMKINYAPDSNFDKLLEDVYTKLNSKC